MQFPKRIKLTQMALGVPKGTIGEVVSHGSERSAVSHIAVKFDCKDEPVLLPYPNDSLTVDVEEEALVESVNP